jgi:2-C-methyl-D-erythritol 4-phosphate cytidylyltransferase
MRYHLIVPAAGSGRRFAAPTPKQYAALGSWTVLEQALALFEADADCASITVAVAEDDAHWANIAMRHPRWATVAGGDQRAHSVRNALRSLVTHISKDDWIFVHDAARPCLASDELARLKLELAGHPVGGLLAVPLADTLKRGDGDPVHVQSTVDRSGLWRAATPQVFRFGVLLPALDAALQSQRVPTDEAQAVEWAGHKPRLVAGRADNIKVTTADDLLMASAILSLREKN